MFLYNFVFVHQIIQSLSASVYIKEYMSKRSIRIISIVLITLLFVALVIWKTDIFNGENAAANNAGQKGPGAVPVTAVVVKPILLQDKVQATGSISPNEEVTITSETSGRITGIYFDEGAKVSKGQLLVRINDSELQATLQKLRYQQQLAKDRENRHRQLLEKEAISLQDYERSATELSTIGAEINLVLAQIAKTQIRAPFEGIIGLRYISDGSYISPGARVADLVDYEPVKIDFSIPEKYAGLVKKGDKITFTIEKNALKYEAEVDAVAPKIDASTRTLQVRAHYHNKNREVIPGSFAKVELVLKDVENALLVPSESLIPELGGQKVFIIKNGKVEPRQVDIGIRSNENIQITKGISVSDTVIASGVLKVRPGMQVQITEFKIIGAE